MDSQNESYIQSRQSKRGHTQGENSLINTRKAQEEQSKQKVIIAEAEIDELKQSLRYVEIQLAKSKEETGTQINKVNETQNEFQKCQENLAKQVRFSQQQQRTIDELTKKLNSFNDNQLDLVEKGRFKAGTYMNEINQRDEEITRMRTEANNTKDEIKLLTVSREQFKQQKQSLSDQVIARDQELDKLRLKVDEQKRVIDHLCMVSKNQGASFVQDQSFNFDKTRDEIERVDRIAKQTNKSSFMNLGDKQPKLVSEENIGVGANKSVLSNPWKHNDETYLTDDTIPSEIFSLIHEYREKLSYSKGGQQSSMIIDDFFSDVHNILKDSHMREVAKIRNEHSVEIMRLRKSIDANLNQFSPNKTSQSIRAKENFQASKANDKFIENEVERQRRALLEENELLKKRLRAVETIINTTSTDKAKFMEGASWIAKKAHGETEKHIQKIQGILGEFQKKSKNTIIDESIYELNGREVLKTNQWLNQQIEKEIEEVGENFDSMFQNVNFHLKEASKEFAKQK